MLTVAGGIFQAAIVGYRSESTEQIYWQENSCLKLSPTLHPVQKIQKPTVDGNYVLG